MHCELVVPALFASREIPRLPAIELLVARGRTAPADRGSLEDWLAAAFSIDVRPVPAGALSLQAGGETPERGGSWVRADPVHLRIGTDPARLIPAAGFEITRAEADRFVASLNEHFGAKASFVAVAPAEWCARTELESDVPAKAPIALAGEAVDAHLPGGRDAALLNEIQMVLHEHPANEEREARGEPAVNSLWLWGSGRLPASAESPWQSLTADPLLATGIAKLAGVESSAVPPSGIEWLARSPQAGRHLLVLDQLRGALELGGAEGHAARIGELEARWFAPLRDALKAGRLGMVTLHVPEVGRSWETIRGDLRRFWRRARPLSALA